MSVSLDSQVVEKEPTVMQEVYAFTVFPKDNRIDIVVKDYDTNGVENDVNQRSLPLSEIDENGDVTSSIFTPQLYSDVKTFLYQVCQDNGWIGSGTVT